MNKIVFTSVASLFFYLVSYSQGIPPSELIANAVSASSVRLFWMDNSNNETEFVIERSQTPDDEFMAIAIVPANTVDYTDTNPNAGIYYYRVKGVINNADTHYTNNASVMLNMNPIVMGQGRVTTRNGVFLDPGGLGNYTGSQNTVTSIGPFVPGSKVKVVFHSFSLKPGDVLNVYDGLNTQAPQIGTYFNTIMPPHITSTNEFGALTFELYSYWNSGTSASGWHADVFCEFAPETPTNLVATPVSDTQIDLTWQDNALDETEYLLERKVFPSPVFQEVVRLPANTINYLDNGLINNSVYTYRVRTLRGSTYSAYSAEARVTLGKAPVMLTNGNYTICDEPLVSPYLRGSHSDDSGYLEMMTTLLPDEPGKRVSINLSELNLDIGNDYLEIYDGASDGSSVVYSYTSTGDQLPGIITASNPEGKLTISFGSYELTTGTGWKADVSCLTAPATPTNLLAEVTDVDQTHLTWQDNADDETGYLVERATGNQYVVVATLAADAQAYDDIDLVTDRMYSYRVRAVRDHVFSNYSNGISVTLGDDLPVLMHASTDPVRACGRTFLDNGGDEDYVINREYEAGDVLTFMPDVPGNRVVVDFSSFDLGIYSDELAVYNGSTTEAPLLGRYKGNAIPPVLMANNEEGTLTFRFFSYYDSNPGWNAVISCVTPPATPVNLLAEVTDIDKISLTWEDLATDETGYVIERATGNTFVTIATLGVDVRSYEDIGLRNDRMYTYRIRAMRDGLFSDLSNTSSAVLGAVPVLMHQGTVTICNNQFLDSGGDENYVKTNGYEVLTISPDEPGKMVTLNFATLDLDKTSFLIDHLEIFNGGTTQSPLLEWNWYYTTATLPKAFQAANPDGKLTIRFKSGRGTSKTGWEATIGCVTKGVPQIVFADRTLGYRSPDDGGSQEVRATAYPGAVFTYSIVDDGTNTGEITLPPFVNVRKTGIVKIKASLAETAYYQAAEKTITLTLVKGRREVNFPIPTPIVVDRLWQLNATIGLHPRPAYFTYEVVADPGNTGEIVLSGPGNKTATAVRAGTVKLKASLPEDDLYEAEEKMVTFTIQKAIPSIVFPGMVSRVGSTPFNLNATAYEGANFSYSIVNANTGEASLSGSRNRIVTPVKPGEVLIRASLPETADYLAAERSAILTINDKLDPEIEFNDLTAVVGVTGNGSFDLEAIAYYGANFTYSIDHGSQNTGEVILSGVGNRTVTVVKAGIVKLRASLNETQNYKGGEKIATLRITETPAEIIFPGINTVFGTPSFDLNATSYEGAIFTYSVDNNSPNTGEVILSGNGNKTVSIRKAGTVKLKAVCLPQGNYPINEKTATLVINKAEQSIEFTQPADVLNSASPFLVHAQASSGLPVSYVLKSGPATILNNRISLTKEIGTITVEAMQSGNENYHPAVSVQRSFAVLQDLTLAIEDDNELAAIVIWPVPAMETVNIKSKANKIEALYVMDMLGRVLIHDTPTKTDCQLDVKALDRGMYTLHIQTEGGVTAIRRLQIVK
jgi:Secretion system C-terminal sorting domain